MVSLFRRAPNQRAVQSFDEPMILIARSHIMGEKKAKDNTPHPSDAGKIEEIQKLPFENYCRIATGEKIYLFPTAVSNGAAAALYWQSSLCRLF